MQYFTLSEGVNKVGHHFLPQNITKLCLVGHVTSFASVVSFIHKHIFHYTDHALLGTVFKSVLSQKARSEITFLFYWYLLA